MEVALSYGVRRGVLRARRADHGEHADPGHSGRGGESERPAAPRREHGVDEVEPEQQHREVEPAYKEGDHPHHPDTEGGRRRRRGGGRCGGAGRRGGGRVAQVDQLRPRVAGALVLAPRRRPVLLQDSGRRRGQRRPGRGAGAGGRGGRRRGGQADRLQGGRSAPHGEARRRRFPQGPPRSSLSLPPPPPCGWRVISAGGADSVS